MPLLHYVDPSKGKYEMQALRILLTAIGVAFGALIIWAIYTGDFSAAGTWLTTDAWGIVTLADLYFGFLLSAVVIYYFERGARAWFWIIPIPFLGNVWTVIWFIWRLPAIINRFEAKNTGSA